MTDTIETEHQPTSAETLGKGGEFIAEPAKPAELPAGGDPKFMSDKGYDWASHGKEAAFKAAQKADKQPAAEPAKVEPTPAEEKAEEPAPEADKSPAEETLEKAGLDAMDIGKSIAEHGDIGKEAREALNKIGVTDEVINRYVEFEKADLSERVSAVVEALGGVEGFSKVQNWAQANLTKEQMGEYEGRLNDPTTSEAAAQELAQKVGLTIAPAPVRGDNTAPATSDAPVAFQSDAELQAAIANPLYRQHSPEGAVYRQAVLDRAKATPMSAQPRFHNTGHR